MIRKLLVAVALSSLVAQSCSTFAEDPARDQARSMTVNRYGIVATSQAVASAAGAAILARGGNAVDAAIAANAALGVIEPMMNGVGGDLFAIYYEAGTKKLYGLNASGWSPAAMSIEALRAQGITGEIPSSSIHAVSVPGAVAGWDALRRRFGKLSLADDLAPAIALAEKGVPIPETDAENWLTYGTPFAENSEFAGVFLPGGKAPVTGQIFRDPELAATLRRIAENGRDGFYKGPTAEAILTLERKQHGLMTAADLADFEPEWTDPVSTTYHGWTVYELPPNGQGIAALSMLNIMEQFSPASPPHRSKSAIPCAVYLEVTAVVQFCAGHHEERGSIPLRWQPG